MPFKPKIREGLDVLEIDDEAIVFDPESRSLLYLNQPANLVFKFCDGTAYASDMAKDIAEAFGVPESRTVRQVRQIIRTLRGRGFLEDSEAHYRRIHELHTAKEQEEAELAMRNLLNPPAPVEATAAEGEAQDLREQAREQKEPSP